MGELRPEIQAKVGFSTTVVLPAAHDTGSAFLAVPARDGNGVYISSGTWSLLGIENSQPITTEASRLANFTNEGGAWYRYRYLKNIMGLWMIQSIRRELNGVSYVAGRESRSAAGKEWSFSQLAQAAREAAEFPSVVDVNLDCFLSPESMAEAVKQACGETGQPVPETVGQLMQCVYKSLAEYYARSIQDLAGLTGKAFTGIHIVGGGSQDSYLNELTAKAAGLPVFAGPTEGTAIGNLVVQMIRGGEFADLEAARRSIEKSFAIKEVQP